MQTISMTACSRPKYTSRVLNGLSQCIGIEGCKLFVRLEPGYNEVFDLFRKWNASDIEVHVNSSIMGCGLNNALAITHGCENTTTGFNIHIEDDTVPAIDALEFFRFARNNGFQLSSCYVPKTEVKGELNQTVLERHFWCWVWQSSVGLWEKHLHNVMSLFKRGNSWGVPFKESLDEAGDLVQLRPMVARSCNIGAAGGVHTNPEWHRQNQDNTRTWAGAHRFTPVLYDDWLLPENIQDKPTNIMMNTDVLKNPGQKTISWRRRNG